MPGGADPTGRPRLRRDFRLLLGLIAATPEDYRVVRELVVDLRSEGVGATVSQVVRETVAAVNTRYAEAEFTNGTDRAPISVTAVGPHLGIDKSSASRRVNEAIRLGYLRDLESVRGRPSRLELGDPLPEDRPLLPTVDHLAECCSVAP